MCANFFSIGIRATHMQQKFDKELCCRACGFSRADLETIWVQQIVATALNCVLLPGAKWRAALQSYVGVLRCFRVRAVSCRGMLQFLFIGAVDATIHQVSRMSCSPLPSFDQ